MFQAAPASRHDRTMDRVAPLIAAIEALDPDIAGPSRHELSQAWAEDALAEHSSIAAFAQLSLDLLALGAPPQLVAWAHAAALDEIDHARCSFAIAARFAGQPVGPGPLGGAGHPCAPDPGALVVETTRHGCLGEAAAAVIAARERDACEVPAIRAVLAMIARDEAMHASLAWRIVAWAVAEHDLHDRLEATLVPDAISPRLPSPLARFGRLGPARAHVAATVHARIVDAPARFLVDPDGAIAELMP